MNNIFNSILVMILGLNLVALGNRRILSVIRIIAFQGIILGILPLIIHEEITFSQLIASLAAISLKGIVIPLIMTRAMRDVKIKKEVEPLIGYVPSIILGALVTSITFILFNQLLVGS